MPSLSDVEAKQAAIASESSNVAIGVDRAKHDLPPSSLDAWYTLARQCLAFTGKDVTIVDYDEAQSLLMQLAAWRNTLTAMGVQVPGISWGQVPHTTPPPGPGLLDRLTSEYGPVLLVALWAWSKMTR